MIPSGQHTGATFKSFTGPNAEQLRKRALVLAERAKKAIYFRGGKGQQLVSEAQHDGSVIRAFAMNFTGVPIVKVWVERPSHQHVIYPEELVTLYGGFYFSPSREGASLPVTYLMTVAYEPSKAQKRWNTVAESIIRPVFEVDKITKPVSWFGRRVIGDIVEEAVVTYDHGLETRYRLYPKQDCSGQLTSMVGGMPQFANAGKSGICWQGRSYDTKYDRTSPEGQKETVSIKVVGAAIFQKWFVIVTHRDLDIYDDPAKSYYDNAIDQSGEHPRTATVLASTDGDKWFVVGKNRFDFTLLAPWCFSPNGSHAITVVDTYNSETTEKGQAKYELFLSQIGDHLAVSFNESTLNDYKEWDLEVTTESDPIIIEGYYESLGVFYASLTQVWNCGSESYDTVGWVDGIHGAPSAPYCRVPLWYTLNEEQLAYYAALAADPYSGSTATSITYEKYSDNYGIVSGSTVSIRGGIRSYYRTQDGSVFRYICTPKGHKTIAFDFSASGNEQELYLEFLSDQDNVVYEVEIQDRQWEDVTPVVFNNQLCSIQHHERDIKWESSFDGKLLWELKVNNDVIFQTESYAKTSLSHHYNHKYNGEASCEGQAAPYVEPVETASCSRAGEGYVERSWIIDVDARTKTCIFEKERFEFNLNEDPPRECTVSQGPYPNFTLVGCLGPLKHIFGCVGSDYDHKKTLVADDSAGILLVERFIANQIVPRFFDPSDNEEPFPAFFVNDYHTAQRYYACVPYDRMARVMREGGLQSRGDSFLYSFANDTTKDVLLFGMHDGVLRFEEVDIHPRTALFGGVIRNQNINLVTTLNSSMNEDIKSRYDRFDDNIYLYPITVI